MAAAEEILPNDYSHSTHRAVSLSVSTHSSRCWQAANSASASLSKAVWPWSGPLVHSKMISRLVKSEKRNVLYATVFSYKNFPDDWSLSRQR